MPPHVWHVVYGHLLGYSYEDMRAWHLVTGLSAIFSCDFFRYRKRCIADPLAAAMKEKHEATFRRTHAAAMRLLPDLLRRVDLAQVVPEVV